MPKIAYVGGFLPFLDPLHTIKTFSAIFPTRLIAAFPTGISHKIFLQDFPTRFSRKIFPQDFPELDPVWFALHHPIPNATFSPITAFLKLAFSPPPCPTTFSCKNFPQDFPARFSHKIFLSWILIGWLPHHPIPNSTFPKITAFLKLAFSPPPCPTTFSCKNFPQDFPTRFS